MSKEIRSLVVVPAFNEESSIDSVIRSIRSQGYDVLVVDDGSTDRTALFAEGAGALVLNLPVNLGVGGALRAGFRFAVKNGYESVIQVDADGQHPTDQIRELELAANEHRAHLVIGSRYLSASSTLVSSTPRRISMMMLARIATRLTGTRLTDTTSGFRLIRQPLLASFAESFPDYYLGDTFEATVLAGQARFRITEVPASLSPRMHGASSSSTLKSIQLVARVLIATTLQLSPRLRQFINQAEINVTVPSRDSEGHSESLTSTHASGPEVS